MRKGDVVLIPFPFTDLSGAKVRPALILINSPFDVTVCFITAQLKWQGEFDLSIAPSWSNGIKRPSVIRVSKMATIDKDLVLGRLGTLSFPEISSLNNALMGVLSLQP